MMSDYSRTQELITAAYDSEGSSQEQFEKTLDSLEAKLNELKNAWDAFTMGLANNDVIKFVVDALTLLLNLFNKVTDIFGSTTGSVLKLVAAFALFAALIKTVPKLTNKISTSIVTGLSKSGDEAGTKTVNNLTNKLKTAPAQAYEEGVRTGKAWTQGTLDGMNGSEQNDYARQLLNQDDQNTGESKKIQGQTKDGSEAKAQKKDSTGSNKGKIAVGALAAAGLVVSSLTNSLREANEELTKQEEAALKGSDAFSTVAVSAASLISVLVQIGVVSAASMGWIALIAAAVAAAAGAIVYLINKEETVAERAERLNKEYEKQKGLVEDLTSAYGGYRDAIDSLDELTYGTEEYTAALKKASEQALALAELSGNYDMISWSEEGYWKIDVQKYNEWKNTQEELEKTTKLSALAAQSKVDKEDRGEWDWKLRGSDGKEESDRIKQIMAGRGADINALNDFYLAFNSDSDDELFDLITKYGKTIEGYSNWTKDDKGRYFNEEGEAQTQGQLRSAAQYVIKTAGKFSDYTPTYSSSDKQIMSLENDTKDLVTDVNQLTRRQLSEFQGKQVEANKTSLETVLTARQYNAYVEEYGDDEEGLQKIAEIVNGFLTEATNNYNRFYGKEGKDYIGDLADTFKSFTTGELLQIKEQKGSLKKTDAKALENGIKNSNVEDQFDSILTDLVNTNKYDQYLTDAQKEMVKNLLEATDFTDKTQVEALQTALEELGITCPDLQNALVSLSNDVLNAGYAIRKTFNFDAETIGENRATLREKAESGERNWTREEYEALIEQAKEVNPAIAAEMEDMFVRNGKDSFGFVGDYNKLIAENSKIEEKHQENAKESAKQNAEAQEAAKSSSGAKTLLGQVEKYGNGEGFTDYFKRFGTSHKADFRNVLSQANISDVLFSSLSGGLDYEKYFGKNADWLQMTKDDLAPLYAFFDQLLNTNDFIDYNNTLDTSIPFYGLTTSEILAMDYEKGSKEETDRQKALLDRYNNSEYASGYYSDIADDKTMEGVEDFEATVKGLAATASDSAEKFFDLNSAISDNYDTLKEGKKETDAYKRSMATLKKAMSEAFGGQEFSDEFIVENLEKIKAAADGDTLAFTELQQTAFETGKNDWAKTLKTDVTTLGTQMNTVFGHNWDTEATMDATPFLDSLNLAKGETADFERMLQEAGYKLEWVPIGADESGIQQYKGIILNTGRSAIGGSSGGGGGGGGGGGSKKNWENPYDPLYNLTEEINEALREREKLERSYDRLLESRNASFSDLIENTLSSMANLRHEIELQKRLQEGRRSQLENIASETYTDGDGKETTFEAAGVTKYGYYDFETQSIVLDLAAINAVKDEEEGAAIEAYVGRLEELQEQYEETQETLEDMEDALEELKQRGKEEYLDFEQKVYDAIVQRQQTLIDDFEDLSSEISDTNSKILEDLQNSIDLQRQIRDNTKTEEDIADKEARLAYLQRDTSGANAVEILKLQEELDQARQDYQDTLIDQELDRLNEANDIAAEQRERQIEIMQSQLEWQEKNGEFWEEAYALIQGAFNEDGTFNNNSALVQLLKDTESFKGMSEFGKMNWITELIKEYNQSQLGFASWMVDKESVEGNVLDDSKGLVGADSLTYKDGDWVDEEGSKYSVVYDPETRTYQAEKVEPVKGVDEFSGGQVVPSPEKGKNRTYTASYKQWYFDTNMNRRAYTEQIKTSTISQDDADALARDAESKSLAAALEASGQVLDEAVMPEGTTASQREIWGHANTFNVVRSGKLTFIKDLGNFKLYEVQQKGSEKIGPYYTKDDAINEGKKKTDDNFSKAEASMKSNNIRLVAAQLLANYAKIKGEITTVDQNKATADARRLLKYKTGGLNTETGPAWLDGTPSRPEYVLNATQTDAFLKLTEVLPSIMKDSVSAPISGGDTYYDVKFLVDEISSDYDVDKLWERFKQKIYEDGSYRNTTVINRLR